MIKIKKVQEYYNEQEEEKPCIMEVQKEYTVDDIKSNLNKVIDEIKRILLSNGVKKYNIKINSKEDLNKGMVIKLIKLS